MKATIKIKQNKQFQRFTKNLTIPIFIYLNILTHLFMYSCTGNIYAETRQDMKNDTRITELQVKLDELNASLAAVNNDNGNDSEQATEKEENIIKKNDTNEKKIIETKKTEIQEKEKEKKNESKQNTLSGEEYSREKKKTEWIIRTIDNAAHKDRKYAINQILSIKDQALKKRLGEKLIEIIKNEIELEVKIKAITVAGEIKLNESLPYLINSLNNEPEDVNVAAVYAIKRIGDLSAKPALIAKLKEQKFENNTNLTEALIDTLGEFKAAELSSFASEKINDVKTDQIIRELLVLFLGKIDSKEPKDVLLGLLKDEEEKEQIRAFAANSLANLKMTEVVPDIVKVIQEIDSYSYTKKKKYYNLYIHCIAALVKLGDEKAFPMLLNTLRSDNAVIRLKAVSLIKNINDKRSIDILKYKMHYDPSQRVQSAAKEALKELGVDVESVQKDDSKIEFDKKNKATDEEEIKNTSKDEPVN